LSRVGAIAIGVDDRVREGERVGTLLAIPNGQLADAWIESELDRGHRLADENSCETGGKAVTFGSPANP
jgi:hypothetical protein